MLGANLSFAEGYCGEVVDTMWELAADLSLASRSLEGSLESQPAISSATVEAARGNKQLRPAPGLTLSFPLLLYFQLKKRKARVRPAAGLTFA